MPYEIPQFIDIEDKIFGPLSLKQFLYLVGGAGLSYLIWVSMPIFFAILTIIPVLGLSASLAFYKVNNLPFINVLQNAIRYFFNKKLYIWKKEPPKIKKQEGKITENISNTSLIPKLSESKLRDLAWGLDVRQSLYAGTDLMKKAKEEKVFGK